MSTSRRTAPTLAPSAIPTSRLGRFARLAVLGTRAGASRVAAALGGDLETGLAETAAEALGTMRGLALKVGQMASYVDGFVPEEHRDLYERTMRSLRDAAPAMPPEASARVVTEELGAPPAELFAAFSPEPFASASIGQVHHATLHDGREVAVKVQHEGVARAVEADLSNASLFGALAGPLGTKVALKEQLVELRARFREELDYEHEASRQRRFAGIFAAAAEHPPDRWAARSTLPPGLLSRVRIPAVIEDRSARRVMTSELARGLDLDAACQRPEEERTAWAETLWVFVFGSLLGHGLFNADPHPGNYLFAEDGAVWFLDFGCTREVRDARMGNLRQAHRAACRGDDDTLVEQALRMMDLPSTGEQGRLSRLYILHCFEPIRTPGPYRLTRPFARSLFDEMKENAVAVMRGSLRDVVPLPAEWLFFNRLQLGFYSVLARLDAPVDYNALERRLTDVAAVAAGGARACDDVLPGA